MRIVYFILVVGVALVFYLSWVPSPALKNVSFIPDWLANWTDTQEFENMRTGVPFVVLGFCTGLLPVVGAKELVHRWFISWLVLIAIVTLAEIGQLFLPHRAFSLADIGWGAAGALVGLSIAALVKKT